MNTIEAIVLGVIQGLTEFLPVSSSGHLVLFQNLFGLKEPELLFDICLHVGTLAAVLIVFYQEILEILTALVQIPSRLRSAGGIANLLAADRSIRMAMLIVVGSIPTAVIGLLFKEITDRLFGSLTIVGCMLLVTGTLLWLTRAIRAFVGRTDPVSPRHLPEIEFIGVWDTVDAYGFPIDEIAMAWNTLVYPIYFPDHKLSKKVRKACHALSVDDERHTFHPVLWDESDETDPVRIEQVWFPGVHSDVGGGYPRQALSLVALDWMIEKAAASSEADGSPGLHLLPRCREEFEKHADWHGPQHDSRAMAAARGSSKRLLVMWRMRLPAFLIPLKQ